MSDVEPTINGVGGEGFAVDGTDSFAIKPTAVADEPGGAPPAGRRGLYLTLATGLVLVLIVVIAGSAGDNGESSLRSESSPTSSSSSSRRHVVHGGGRARSQLERHRERK